ncbi:hypothetical protein [Streptomyces globisporus]
MPKGFELVLGGQGFELRGILPDRAQALRELVQHHRAPVHRPTFVIR